MTNSTHSHARPDLSGKAVLIAEDEAMIALDLEMIIEDLGGQVVGPFANLSDLLAGLDSETFDLALLDVMLGRDEVFPAAEILAEQGVPFVFHTGNADRRDIFQRFPKAGVCSKPTSLPNLYEALVNAQAARN